VLTIKRTQNFSFTFFVPLKLQSYQKYHKIFELKQKQVKESWFHFVLYFLFSCHSDTRPRPPCGSLPLHYLLCKRTHPYPVTLLPVGLGYFRAKPSPVGIPTTILKFSRYLPTCLWRWNRHSVPKRRHIKFRRRGITQKKTYNIKNTAKVWNQEYI